MVTFKMFKQHFCFCLEVKYEPEAFEKKILKMVDYIFYPFDKVIMQLVRIIT